MNIDYKATSVMQEQQQMECSPQYILCIYGDVRASGMCKLRRSAANSVTARCVLPVVQHTGCHTFSSKWL